MRHFVLERAKAAPAAGHIRVFACVACAAPLTLGRDALPAMDSSGFEVYSIECDRCGAALGGVVDPMDGTLLVSELAR